MIRYFIDGGIFMWIILLTSIFGVTIILEKLWMLYTRERDLERKYRKQIYSALMNKSREEIIELTKKKKDSVSKIVTKTMESIDLDFDEIDESNQPYLEEIIREAVLAQTGKLENGIWLLGAVVNTAPQLGLLGTVTGMITSFSALSSSETSSKLVAGGISEALYTTAFGLIVAIPALIFYNYFNRRLDSIVLEMERAALHFLSRIKK
ncbi:MAG: MotA/TolQ/ExbB proton channel family protein [Leptotrichiaceae bacterium]|nr:MotA/TolQ/ExbB proton channel family protein [Leptotrichiaceae bacterium]MBP7100201.1 MotA/TolQ/ExbB proton channel family protein [Leptotrichiaceae bacterium]MBP7725633.1 MotA/TolQ/ExbB proton channel family protein [Leptotrichiaceae bacterium]MBP9630271.1 MotA/TolQ/ExbB proton channel family protein [Leptotrichiaceae bacterium]